jgi:hypothetical protein
LLLWVPCFALEYWKFAKRVNDFWIIQVLIFFLTLQLFSSRIFSRDKGFWSIYFIDERCTLYHNYMVEGKVVPMHAMKAHKGSGGVAPIIITLGIKWEWSASCPSHYCTAGLKAWEKRCISCLLPGVVPQFLGYPGCSLATIPTELL